MAETHGNGQWIKQAVATYQEPLVAYASRLTGNADLARDVVQDAFLKMVDRPPPPEVTACPTRTAAWLYAVTRNRAIDLRRRDRRMTTLAAEHLELPGSGAPTAQERSELTLAATQALASLPDQQREVIRLKFQHGLSYKEIARLTGLTVSHVGYLICMGLKAVRGRLEHFREDTP